MYGAHVGGRAVRSVFSAPRIGYARVTGPATMWGLGGSASLRDRTLTLTVVNPHISEPSAAEIVVRAATVKTVRAAVIAAADIHAHNTFDRPDTVRQRETPAGPASGATLAHTFPPASVTRLTMDLV